MEKMSLKLSPLLLLAAGDSSRMGSPKGLLPFRGRPWILEQLDRYIEAGGSVAVVILGKHHAEYVKAAPDLAYRCKLLINPHPESGPFSSVQIGIRFLLETPTLETAARAAFVLPVDVACPSPLVWNALETALHEDFICVPKYEGAGGHPVLLNRSFMKSLLQEPPTGRLDEAIRSWGAIREVRVCDERIRTNLNTPEHFLDFASGGRHGR